ncbi:MAG: BglG family transcription antiterminator [Clostridium sp.]|uniref:BglG family transcription antiterminator n=1 Tax=Clostridium sp. TaxID=1506 RepID=UPI003EE56EFE
MYISKRMCEILNILNNERGTYIKSDYIADMLGFSSRTIKRDLKEITSIIESYGAEIEATNKGYRLNIKEEDDFKKFINKYLLDDSLGANESKKDILILELLLSNEYISQDEISSELYLSRSSINKEILSVKNMLKEYNLKIQNKPHYGYVLEGKEIDIRNCMVRYLTANNEENSIIISEKISKGNEKNNILIEYIKNLFMKININKNDLEISYITRYVIVSVYRIFLKNEINLNNEINISLDKSVVQASKEICNKLYSLFDISLEFEEMLYISYIIGNNKSSLFEEKHDKNNIEEMVIHAIDEINNVYGIDFNKDNTLLKGLINHLYTSYSRYCLNVKMDNPMINLIKSKYIEAYNYSVLFKKVIEEDYGIDMSEEEIGYIALHFAASIERSTLNKSLRVILVCSSGVGTAELLKVRISNKFSNIFVQGVYPAYMINSLDLSDIDLIISTVKIKDYKLEKEMINVSALLEEADVEKINEYIKKQRDYEYLDSLFCENLYLKDIKANTKEEALEFMSNELIKLGAINEKTKDTIIERERLSSTEINDFVAIPHCLATENDKSIIAVGILKKPIKWDKKNVQIIFLGVLNPKTKENRKVFTMIYKLTKNKNKVKNLINIEDYIVFKKKFLK